MEKTLREGVLEVGCHQRGSELGRNFSAAVADLSGGPGSEVQDAPLHQAPAG